MCVKLRYLFKKRGKGQDLQCKSNLRRRGFSQEDLLRVYIAMIHSVAEYCQVVYHTTIITEEESKWLDKLESQCLKNIYGKRLSYKIAGIDSLSDRRAKGFDLFAHKAASSAAFRHWFPRKVDRLGGRHCEVYKEYFACTDRLRFLPRFVMRLRLNGKTNEPIKPGSITILIWWK